MSVHMDISGLKDLQRKLNNLRQNDFDEFCTACAKELAARLLAKAIKRTPVGQYPRKSGKKPRVIEDKTVLLIRDENRTAIRKRPEKGLLAGMYEFPMLEGHKEEKEVLEYVKGLGYGVIYIKELEPSKHIFTHREWHMTGYLIRVDELERPELSGQYVILESLSRVHGRGVQSEELMRRAMLEAKSLGKIIVAHCEDNSLLRGGYIHDGVYAKAHNHK